MFNEKFFDNIERIELEVKQKIDYSLKNLTVISLLVRTTISIGKSKRIERFVIHKKNLIASDFLSEFKEGMA